MPRGRNPSSASPVAPTDGRAPDVRERLLATASALFYLRGVRAVGIDLIIEQAGIAKASLYRHFRTKDDLVAAFLEREDADFWRTWDEAAARYDDPRAELGAQLAWIGERIARPGYRGCPQLNVATEFPDDDHPARVVARNHKLELRRRLLGLAERLDVMRPDELAGQLTVLVNGALVSSSVLSAEEAAHLLHEAAAALVEAMSPHRA